MIIINDEYRAAFLQSYMGTAEWASTHTETEDSDPVPIDSLGLDWAPEAEAEARKWCNDFIDLAKADLILAGESRDGIGPEQMGHDFWLTSNGHGAGFWDRGLGDVGRRLTDACKNYAADLYVGDDGKLWLQ